MSVAAAAAAKPELVAEEAEALWEPVRRCRRLPTNDEVAVPAFPFGTPLQQDITDLETQQPALTTRGEAEAAPLPALAMPAALQPPLPASQPFQLPVPNLGYTCLNLQLQQQHGYRTNRSGPARVRLRRPSTSLPCTPLLPTATAVLHPALATPRPACLPPPAAQVLLAAHV